MKYEHCSSSQQKNVFFPQAVALMIHTLTNSSTIFHKQLIIRGLEKAELFPD